jgi:hypothetical protein
MTNDAVDINEVAAPPRFRFRLRTFLIAIGLVAIFFGGCRCALRLMSTPRVSAVVVERELRRDLPLGTAEAEVVRFMNASTYSAYAAQETPVVPNGRRTLEYWIFNTGSPGDVAKLDIRIQFDCDDEGRLTDIVALTLPRM